GERRRCARSGRAHRRRLPVQRRSFEETAHREQRRRLKLLPQNRGESPGAIIADNAKSFGTMTTTHHRAFPIQRNGFQVAADPPRALATAGRRPLMLLKLLAWFVFSAATPVTGLE